MEGGLIIILQLLSKFLRWSRRSREPELTEMNEMGPQSLEQDGVVGDHGTIDLKLLGVYAPRAWRILLRMALMGAQRTVTSLQWYLYINT